MRDTMPRFKWLMVVVVLILCPCSVIAADPPEIAELILDLNDDNSRIRKEAAEDLAKIVDPKISAPVQKRIVVEKDFHVKLALNYALAAQGNKAPLQVLINSLKLKGHKGSIYLEYATGEYFGGDLAEWQKWFNSTSEDDFRKFTHRRWKRILSWKYKSINERSAMKDEWDEFNFLNAKRSLSSDLSTEILADMEKSIGISFQITEAEMKRLSELPTEKAWILFVSALRELQEKGNRKKAAQLFRKITTDFSKTHYADQSEELADLLDKMVVEDSKFTPPKNIKSQNIKTQINFHIHNLRDVVGYQYSQPGSPSIMRPFIKGYNAAIALRDIGESAVPYLIELLDDHRPIRAVGYFRHFLPLRYVLRYKDAAITILHAIRSNNLYDQRLILSYRSAENPEAKKKIKEQLRKTIKSK